MKTFLPKITDDFGNEGEVLFERMTGSRLYGTSYEMGEHPFYPDYVSDWDFRGVFMIPVRTKMLLPPFNKYSENIKLDEYDSEMYEIGKFFKEAMKNNPNHMDLLFGDDKSLIGCSNKGRIILDNKDHFLCEDIISSFIGFANSQLTRIKNHNRWHTRYPDIYDVQNTISEAYKNRHIDFNLISNFFSGSLASFLTNESATDKKMKGSMNIDEFIQHYFSSKSYNVYDYMKPHALSYLSLTHNDGFKVREIGEYELGFIKERACFHKKNESLYFLYPNGKGIFAENGTIYPSSPVKPSSNDPIKFIMTFDYTAFKSKQDDIKDLWRWKIERNPKRAILEEKFGYDVKHGMHTYRLLDSAILVCETGTYTPRLSGDKLQNAKDILAGHWSYQELLNEADKKIKTLNEHKKKKSLPNQLDLKLLSDIYNSLIFD